MEQPHYRLPLEDLAALEGGPLCSTIALFAPIAMVREEVAVFAYLDPDWRLLGTRHIASGLTDAVTIPLRAVVTDALAFDCSAVVMAHNHPTWPFRSRSITQHHLETQGLLGLS